MDIHLKSFAKELLKKDNETTLHYYGDNVRKLFILGAIIIMLSLPFFSDLLPVPVFVSIASILTLGFAAGLTNPTQMWVVIVNTIISASALVIFEYYAVANYLSDSIRYVLSLINQILAIVFLIALYYSVKTLRGMFLRR